MHAICANQITCAASGCHQPGTVTIERTQVRAAPARPASVTRTPGDMKVWRAICDESYGTKKDRRAELAKRARRARWPEAPPPPTQLGMFG